MGWGDKGGEGLRGSSAGAVQVVVCACRRRCRRSSECWPGPHRVPHSPATPDCPLFAQDGLVPTVYRFAQDGLPAILPHVTKQLFEPSIDEIMTLLDERCACCCAPLTPLFVSGLG